jgi:hypothetical protein
MKENKRRKDGDKEDRFTDWAEQCVASTDPSVAVTTPAAPDYASSHTHIRERDNKQTM